MDSVAFDNNKWLKVDSIVKYRKAVPIVRNVPPMSAGNPWEVNLAYFVIDSVLRSSGPSQLDSIVMNRAIGSDTLCKLYKYFYMLSDFNSRTLAQYDIETRLATRVYLRVVDNGDTIVSTIGRYRSRLHELKYSLIKRFATQYATDTLALAKQAVLDADVIAKILVVRVDSSRVEYTSVMDSVMKKQYYYKVTAQILDTLKGGTELSQSDSIGGAVFTNPPSHKYISFDYSTATYPILPGGMPDFAGSTKDNLATDPVDGQLRLKVGKTMVVFLKYQAPLLDATHDYLRLSVDRNASLGVLLLNSNDTVRDLNSIWRLGNSPSYSNWVTRFQLVVSQLTSCN